MKTRVSTAAAAVAAVILVASCGPSDERTYEQPGDTPRAAPAATPTPGAQADSTTGVARSSGQPGVAGDTISRSSKISPPGKAT